MPAAPEIGATAPHPKPFARLGVAAFAGLVLSGCISAGASVGTFALRTGSEGDATLETRSASLSLGLSPTEIAYARDTSRVLFRRRDGERSAGFVRMDPEDGYALCLRAGGDYALLIFQRRVFASSISQAEDDAVILRTPADTAVCRTEDDWTRV